jgi:hypothetical protein
LHRDLCPVARFATACPSIQEALLLLLLLLVFRPEYLHTWVGKAYHVRMALVRLPEASSAEMVKSVE